MILKCERNSLILYYEGKNKSGILFKIKRR